MDKHEKKTIVMIFIIIKGLGILFGFNFNNQIIQLNIYM